MSKQNISLGRIMGISIRFGYSWFPVLILVTATMAIAYLPADAAWSAPARWLLGSVIAVLFFASVLAHELAHAAVARQLQLPVRRVTLYVFGGIPELGAEPPSPLAEFLIAIAGPLFSFALAGVFALLAGWSRALLPLFVIAKYLAYINGVLAAVNLIPGFPLDGGRVFRAILWGITGEPDPATRTAAIVGRVIGSLFIVFGAWEILNVGWVGWLIVLGGWLVQSAASQQLERQRLHDQLSTQAALEELSRYCIPVACDSTLEQIVDRNLNNVGARAFIVEREKEHVGLLTWRSINAVPRAEWHTTTALQVMIANSQADPARTGAEPRPAVAIAPQEHIRERAGMTAGLLRALRNKP